MGTNIIKFIIGVLFGGQRVWPELINYFVKLQSIACISSFTKISVYRFLVSYEIGNTGTGS
jgi:hypothetical protein